MLKEFYAGGMMLSFTFIQLKEIEQVLDTMRKPTPTYRGLNETFEADNCEPLVEAVRRKEVQIQAFAHGHYPGSKLPAAVLPGLKAVGYWNASGPQTWGLPPHRNEGIEITFLESGNLAFSVDDRQYSLKADALTVTRPWQKHQVGNPNITAGKLHWLIVDVGVRRPNQPWRWPDWLMLSQPDLNELAGILRRTDQPVWRASGEIRHCFHEVGEAIEKDDKGSSISILTVRINEILLLLLGLLRGQKPQLNDSLATSRRSVQLFLEDLKQHPEQMEFDWTVQQMAESCGLGVTRFVHVVKQLTNMPPLHYLNHCRLALAARLLRDRPQDSVTGIAQTCGFSSSQYFATAFARKFGCSPSRFRDSGICTGITSRRASPGG